MRNCWPVLSSEALHQLLMWSIMDPSRVGFAMGKREVRRMLPGVTSELLCTIVKMKKKSKNVVESLRKCLAIVFETPRLNLLRDASGGPQAMVLSSQGEEDRQHRNAAHAEQLTRGCVLGIVLLALLG